MSQQKTELELINTDKSIQPSTFTQDAMEDLIKKIEDEIRSFVPDTSTDKGRKAIASLGRTVSGSKMALENAGKNFVSDWKQKAKQVDEVRKMARERLNSLRDEVLQPLNDYREQERLRMEQEKINQQIEQDYAEALAMNNLFDREAAIAEKEHIAAEKEAEELRKKEAERHAEEKREHEQRLKEQAAEQARKKAEQEAQNKIDEAKRLEAEAVAATERAERERIEAEARAKQKAEQVERERLQALEDARIAKEQAVNEAKEQARIEAVRVENERIRTEAEARRKAEKLAANKAHKASINNAALECFVSQGVDIAQAKKLIIMIAKGKIDHVSINY